MRESEINNIQATVTVVMDVYEVPVSMMADTLLYYLILSSQFPL